MLSERRRDDWRFSAEVNGLHGGVSEWRCDLLVIDRLAVIQ